MTTNFVPVSVQRHKGMLFTLSENRLFTAGDNLAPIVAHEIPKAMLYLPITFIVNGDDYELMLVQGLERGRNVLVDSTGKWRGRYQPEIYRTYPFLSVKNQNDDYTLCIDENSDALGQDLEDGFSFFDDNDKPGEEISKLLELLQLYGQKRENTQQICTLLAAKNLIKPWTLNVEKEGKPLAIEGMHCIDEQALNKLPAEDFLELRDAGCLLIVYAQLLSMHNIKMIWELSQGPADLYGTSIKSEEVSFSGLDDEQVLSFDNL